MMPGMSAIGNSSENNHQELNIVTGTPVAGRVATGTVVKGGFKSRAYGTKESAPFMMPRAASFAEMSAVIFGW